MLFLGFSRPFWKNLFSQGGNDFRQGSFLILWLFCLRLLRPFFVFCFFQASEAHYGKTYLLRVVTTFNKDHFALYDFWGALLFFSGFYDFRQGSFFILCFFCLPRLLRPFCLGVWSGLVVWKFLKRKSVSFILRWFLVVLGLFLVVIVIVNWSLKLWNYDNPRTKSQHNNLTLEAPQSQNKEGNIKI